MRLALIFVCLAALVVIAWFAATRGLDAPFLGGAARIEALTAERVRAATGGTAAALEVTVSGRDVVLAGQSDSPETRDRAIAAAAGVSLVRSVVSRIEVLPLAEPYRLVVVRTPGGLTLSGNVPGQPDEQALLAEARALSPGGVDSALEPASGAPAQWREMARAGLQVLAPLSEGRLEMIDSAVTLTGVAPDAEARAAALAAAEGAPGTWRADIRQPIAYAFTAMKTPDGAVIVSGRAPDSETRDALVAVARTLSDRPVEGTVELAGGSPPPGWAELVGTGLQALASAYDGLLSVAGDDVTFNATVGSEEERSALAERLDPAWQTKLVIAEPRAPPAELRLEYDADRGLIAAGLLPPELSPETLAERMPGIDLEAVRQPVATADNDAASGSGETDARSDAEAGAGPRWDAAVEGLSIVLPRFRQASVRLRGGRLALSGALKRGFSSEGTRATLLAALGRDWLLDLDVEETEPLAEVVFTKDGESLVLSGLLPKGLNPGQAMDLLGVGAIGDGLAGGGAGDSAEWSQAVVALGEAIVWFDGARGRVADRGVTIAGILQPGYEPGEVSDRLAAALPGDWTASVEAEATPAGEGDRRIGPDTGLPEVFRRGFWLPELDFPVSAERCAIEADSALEGEQVRFLTGSAEIDEAGMALIDRLAAIAVRCLNSSEMRLEIAGHTDSVGNDAQNQALSEQRAAAVRDALAERGVRADSLSAAGFGESQPIASNDTAEGRARNRRIAFNWSES